MKPLLLVDVDGVINAFDLYGVNQEEEFNFVADGYVISVPKDVRYRFVRLTEVFEPVWCTTWCHRAGTLLSPELGFGADWDVVDFNNAASFNGQPVLNQFVDQFRDRVSPGRVIRNPLSWKLHPVDSWLKFHGHENRAMAWVDDDFGHDAIAWAEHRNETAPTRLAHCDPNRGLTRSMYEKLMSWGRKNSE